MSQLKPNDEVVVVTGPRRGKLATVVDVLPGDVYVVHLYSPPLTLKMSGNEIMLVEEEKANGN